MYCQVVNDLLARYVTNNINCKVDIDILTFNQHAFLSAIECMKSLWTKMLRCRLLYDEYHLKETIIKSTGE